MQDFFQPVCCRDMRKLKPDETSISKKNTGFAAENINNVTWSYAIFCIIENTMIYTNVVQYKEKYCYSTSLRAGTILYTCIW